MEVALPAEKQHAVVAAAIVAATVVETVVVAVVVQVVTALKVVIVATKRRNDVSLWKTANTR